MKDKQMTILLALLVMFAASAQVFSHCQIPCGIYGDKMRFEMIKEHITTIEKSMTEIIKLSDEDKPNYNQLVRWVSNKDAHADEIMHIAQQYFLAQRIKPVADAADKAANEKYAAQLQAVHHIIVHSMKAKQTTALEHVEALKTLLAEFYKLYFDEEMEAHLEEHAH